MDNKKQKMIYHYTSIESACKIIDSGIIRTTNIMYQNDKREMLQAYDIIKKYLNDLIYGDNSGDSVKKILRSFDFYKQYNFPIFTISFSTKQDDLNQWRAYGNDGRGCCLCFKLDKINEIFEPISSDNINRIFKRCIYEEEEIKECLSELKNRIILEGKNYIPEIANRMNIEMFIDAPFIKHKAYKDESEYRFVFYSEEENFNIKCNENGNPFIEIATKNHFDSIIFGPCVKDEDIEKIKYWLNKNLIDIKLHYSQIPYRGK